MKVDIIYRSRRKSLILNKIATSPEILAEAERVGLIGYVDRIIQSVRFPTNQPKAEGSSRYAEARP